MAITEIELVIRLLASVLFGAIPGIEREVQYKPAGLRTHILVCLGSCLFTVLSIEAFPGSDPSRVASYVVAGIGFIGAGTILQSQDKILGITTASSLWVTAAIGISIGAGYYIAGIATSLIAFIVLGLLGRIELLSFHKDKKST